jgi:hypothetical protein
MIPNGRRGTKKERGRNPGKRRQKPWKKAAGLLARRSSTQPTYLKNIEHRDR